jgi:hypothetical protein
LQGISTIRSVISFSEFGLYFMDFILSTLKLFIPAQLMWIVEYPPTIPSIIVALILIVLIFAVRRIARAVDRVFDRKLFDHITERIINPILAKVKEKHMIPILLTGLGLVVFSGSLIWCLICAKRTHLVDASSITKLTAALNDSKNKQASLSDDLVNLANALNDFKNKQAMFVLAEYYLQRVEENRLKYKMVGNSIFSDHPILNAEEQIHIYERVIRTAAMEMISPDNAFNLTINIYVFDNNLMTKEFNEEKHIQDANLRHQYRKLKYMYLSGAAQIDSLIKELNHKREESRQYLEDYVKKSLNLTK